MAVRVQGSIEYIERNKEGFPNNSTKLHSRIASQILIDLPEQVGTYTHSEELPTITATRYEGETWDHVKTLEWASEVLGEKESNSELRNR